MIVSAILLLLRSGRFSLVAGAVGYFALSSDVRLRDILRLAGFTRRRPLLANRPC
jgi:hypothetical protein